jgi:hypothetical protein
MADKLEKIKEQPKKLSISSERDLRLLEKRIVIEEEKEKKVQDNVIRLEKLVSDAKSELTVIEKAIERANATLLEVQERTKVLEQENHSLHEANKQLK